MDKKYIDTDQLWKCETCFYMGTNGKCRGDCDAKEGYRPAWGKFKFADVAPVVRCGECVHALKSNKCNPDSRLCDLNYYSGGGRKIVNLDGYCHLGRRKRGENAEHCVSCGDVIPEGRQVCPACEKGDLK